MAALKFVLPYQYTCEPEIMQAFLDKHGLRHVCTHGSHHLAVGDALKSKRGVLATIVRIEHEQMYFTLANNHLTKAALAKVFGIPVLQATLVHSYEDLMALLKGKEKEENNLKT